MSSTTFSVQVPQSAAEALRPLEGVLRMTDHDVEGVLRDRLHELAHQLMGIADDAKDPAPNDLREIGSELTQIAAAFEAVA